APGIARGHRGQCRDPGRGTGTSAQGLPRRYRWRRGRSRARHRRDRARAFRDEGRKDMDGEKLKAFVNGIWDDSVVPSITEYIKIPNKSPHFDADWETHGYMADAVRLMSAWAKDKLSAFQGATLDVVQLPGRTPLIFMEIPGARNDDTVLLYGHLDKQP